MNARSPINIPPIIRVYVIPDSAVTDPIEEALVGGALWLDDPEAIRFPDDPEILRLADTAARLLDSILFADIRTLAFEELNSTCAACLLVAEQINVSEVVVVDDVMVCVCTMIVIYQTT